MVDPARSVLFINGISYLSGSKLALIVGHGLVVVVGSTRCEMLITFNPHGSASYSLISRFIVLVMFSSIQSLHL